MAAPRVFISYAHDNPDHERAVNDFWVFLRQDCGIDARLDVYAAQFPQDWPLWMEGQIAEADFTLMIASPDYRARAGLEAVPDVGRGVQWEGRLIRDAFDRDQRAARQRFLGVVLPGRSADDLPTWFAPTSQIYFSVSSFTQSGAEPLLRLLLNQPRPAPPLGAPLAFDRSPLGAVTVPATPGATAATALRHPGPVPTALRLTLTQTAPDHVHVQTDGILSDSRDAAWPPVRWDILPSVAKVDPLMAERRLRRAGRELARALFGEAAQVQLAGLVARLLPEQGLDLTVIADSTLLAGLPLELLWLPGTPRPLALEPGVTLSRQVARAPRAEPVRLAGPTKILAAVAAPEGPQPLDVEAEMQAILDATRVAAGQGQLRVLEVAERDLIREAIAGDHFHVLHLSAHGSATGLTLETADGQPDDITAEGLVTCLKRSHRPVPLIVLSSCSALNPDGLALAGALIDHGADRVIAMQASVSDQYATELTKELYTNLVRHPDRPVGAALADARQEVEDRRQRQAEAQPDRPRPEWPVATLWRAADDAPLVDPAAPAERLSRPQTFAEGGQVRELTLGQLIGRRAETRQALAVFRRRPDAQARHGAVGGVILTGLGGIGKSAIAGRVIRWLRDEGWLPVVHEGLWNPARLFADVAQALVDVEATTAEALGADLDDRVKVLVVQRALSLHRLLLVFDDFEQNLTRGPGDPVFLDTEAGQSTLGEVLAGLAVSAARAPTGGGLLITSRFPLPGAASRALARIDVPPLSHAEWQRLLVRLPALSDLSDDDRRVVRASIGGHPRLLEFLDALLRSGQAQLAEVTERLHRLLKEQGVDLDQGRATLTEAVSLALEAGSRDILLDGLLAALSELETAVLHQAHVCRMALPASDLAGSLDDTPEPPDPIAVKRAVRRLRDGTLLVPGEDVAVLPSVAEMIDRRLSDEMRRRLHRRAIALHTGRFASRTAHADDLIDLPYHHAGLDQFDEAAGVIAAGSSLFPGLLDRLAYFNNTLPAIPRDNPAWVIAADELASAYGQIGNLAAQEEIARHSHALLKERAAADPANTEWQRDLTVSHNRLGGIAQAAGDLAQARAHYQAALDIAQHLAAADPANSQWQRDLEYVRQRLASLDDSTA